MATSEEKAAQGDNSATGLHTQGEQVPVAEGPESARRQAASASDEELPVVETPSTFIVSSFSSRNSTKPVHFDPDTQDPHVPAAPTRAPPAPVPTYVTQRQRTPASPGMSIIKVLPFLHGDDLSDSKPLCCQLLSRRLALLIAVCVLLALSLTLGVGLGVGLRCMGKFRCASSFLCVGRAALCDGVRDCADGEDELNCVRLSGKSSVLQVRSKGVWRTVCSEDWGPALGYSACKQLGYSSYVSSNSLPLSSIEPAFQSSLVSINLTQPGLQQAGKIHNPSHLSKTQCSTGRVTVLKCVACGSRPRARARIVGGNESRLGQVPWQVSLHYQNQHLCGGSIIAAHWVLTAAHCVYGFADPTLWVVHTGLTEQPINGAGSLSVHKIFYHASYRPRGLDYDIALMRLTEPLTFNGLVEPICLPNFGEGFEPGHVCWISGWGAIEDGGEASVALHSARVPLLSSRDCSQPGVYQGTISPWMICAGYLEGGIDSCQGDSGGPLACEDSSVWKLAGTTSWSLGCAERNKPGVYTRITHALAWIQRQMEREEGQSS